MMVTDLFLVCASVDRRFIGRNSPRSLSGREVSCVSGNQKQVFLPLRHVFSPFAAPTETHFTQLHLSFEFACRQPGDMLNCFPQSLADSCCRLVIQSRITRQATCRLPLLESENDFQSPATKPACLLSLTLAPLGLRVLRLTRIERAAKKHFHVPKDLLWYHNLLLPVMRYYRHIVSRLHSHLSIYYLSLFRHANLCGRL